MSTTNNTPTREIPTRYTQPLNPRLGLPRIFIAGTAVTVAAIVWTHALAGLLRLIGPEGAPLAAVSLTLVTAALAIFSVLLWPLRRTAVAVAALASAAVVVAVEVAAPGVGVAASALVVVIPAVTWGGRRLAERLPPSVDRAAGRHRLAAAAWVLLALVAVVQTGRLATFMTDTETDWFLSTRHPFWAKHECLPAYVYGAELAIRGDKNIYDAAHYPALDPKAAPRTEMRGMTVEDPFQYPPQFLLVPALAKAVTNDYRAVRLLWFAVQATFFAGLAAALALWIGGRAGRVALYLLPLAFTAFPALHSFQYGQVHLTVLGLTMASLMAFEARRRALGGAFLAAAALTKIFPAVVAVFLLRERRYRELAWTAGFCVAITVLTLAIFGAAPFQAFVDYQLPRLSSGQAFAFDEAWPEIRDLVVADNQGAFGFVVKLGALGVPGLDKAAAHAASRFFGLAVLVMAFVAARRMGTPTYEVTRQELAVTWLALLGMASLVSTGAWGDYVPVAATWLLTLVAYRMADGPRVAVPIAVCWIFQYFFLGTTPIFEFFSPGLMTSVSLAGVLMMAGLFGWGLLKRPAAARVAAPRSNSQDDDSSLVLAEAV